jgi:hypothetical protein
LPSWLVICIDRSGSLSPQAVQDIKRAVGTSLIHDERGEMPYKVAVVSFASDLRQAGGAKFLSRISEVEEAISSLRRESDPKGRTKLFDAISGALADLRGKQGGKRLIIVSDGKDEGSQLGLADLKRRAGADSFSVPIDTVAYGSESEQFAGALSELAGVTGGRAEAARTSAELSEVLIRLLGDSLKQSVRYVVSFEYRPVASGRYAVNREIVYNRAGTAPVADRLNAPLLAGDILDTCGGQNPCPPSWLEQMIKLFKELPPLIKAIVALLTALSAFFVGKKAITVIHKLPPPNRWSFFIFHSFGPAKTTGPKNDEHSDSRGPVVTPILSRRQTGVGHVWPSPGNGHPIAALRAVAGSVRGRVFSVDKAQYTIGANEDNDLVLIGDGYASGRHAKLRYEAGSLYVEDLGSTNGSSLNGQPFNGEARGLSPGDTLRFGHSTFEVLVATGSRN